MSRASRLRSCVVASRSACAANPRSCVLASASSGPGPLLSLQQTGEHRGEHRRHQRAEPVPQTVAPRHADVHQRNNRDDDHRGRQRQQPNALADQHHQQQRGPHTSTCDGEHHIAERQHHHHIACGQGIPASSGLTVDPAEPGNGQDRVHRGNGDRRGRIGDVASLDDQGQQGAAGQYRNRPVHRSTMKGRRVPVNAWSWLPAAAFPLRVRLSGLDQRGAPPGHDGSGTPHSRLVGRAGRRTSRRSCRRVALTHLLDARVGESALSPPTYVVTHLCSHRRTCRGYGSPLASQKHCQPNTPVLQSNVCLKAASDLHRQSRRSVWRR